MQRVPFIYISRNKLFATNCFNWNWVRVSGTIDHLFIIHH